MHSESQPDFRNKSQFRHRADVPLQVLSVVLSLAVYALLAWLIVIAPGNDAVMGFLVDYFEADEETMQAIVSLGIIAGDVLFVLLVLYVLWTIFKYHGTAASRDVRYSDSQLSEFVRECEGFCEKLGMGRVPELYATVDEVDLEVFGVLIRNPNFIRVDAEMAKQPYETEEYALAVRFYIAREVSRIYLGQCSVILLIFTFPMRCVPLYKHMVSRAMNYSADRLAAALIGNREEAMEAVGMTVVNPELFPFLDGKVLFHEDISDFPFELRSSMVLENLFSQEPIPIFRVDAIRKDTRKGRLF